MAKPEYKVFPCVFCTIGFNSYVAVNKLAAVAMKKVKQKNDQKNNALPDSNRKPTG